MPHSILEIRVTEVTRRDGYVEASAEADILRILDHPICTTFGAGTVKAEHVAETAEEAVRLALKTVREDAKAAIRVTDEEIG